MDDDQFKFHCCVHHLGTKLFGVSYGRTRLGESSRPESQIEGFTVVWIRILTMLLLSDQSGNDERNLRPGGWKIVSSWI